MKREYWYILIAYIGMHLSSFAGVPAVTFAGVLFGYSLDEMAMFSVVFWIVFSFTVTLLIVLFLLRKEIKEPQLDKHAASWEKSAFWAIFGVFLALFAQGMAARVEELLGIEMGSENTEQILTLIETSSLVIIVTSIIGPILEEIVFRKVIFGSLNKRFNFFISGLVSSVIFALAHGEPEHLLLYSAMGFTFAFLYVKTKRILVPIIAHVSMNTFVVLVQSIFKEDIERLIREAEKIQGFIGGLFI